MSENGWALFDTAIGRCGIAWSARGVAGVQLPESSDGETRGRVARRVPRAKESSPPPIVAQAIAGIVALVAGETSPASELAFIEIDLKGIPDFERDVYGAARTVPRGETVTYGDIARRLGDPGASRAVGQALGRNPFPLVVPCHRVLAASGQLGGFSATGGAVLKLRLLRIEGAAVMAQSELFGRA